MTWEVGKTYWTRSYTQVRVVAVIKAAKPIVGVCIEQADSEDEVYQWAADGRFLAERRSSMDLTTEPVAIESARA